MSDTKRLDEGTIRRFMKLAKIEGLADGFVEQNSVLKEGSKSGGRSRSVPERSDEKRAQGRVEEKKDEKGEEVEEGAMHYEAEGEMYEQDELMGMGGEGGMGMGGEGGDAKAVITRVINAIGEEFPELGIQVDEEAGADDMDMEDEPEDDEEMDMEDDEEALGGDEEGDEEGDEDEGEGEEEEMEEGDYEQGEVEETLSPAAKKAVSKNLEVFKNMKVGSDDAEVNKAMEEPPRQRKSVEEPPSRKKMVNPPTGLVGFNEGISLQEAILARVKARLLAEARRGGKAMTAKQKMKMKKKAKSGKPTDEVKKHGGAGLATKGNSKTVGHGGYKKASGKAMEETSGGAGLASKGKNNHKGYKDSDVGGVAKSSGKSGNLTPAGKPKKSHGV